MFSWRVGGADGLVERYCSCKVGYFEGILAQRSYVFDFDLISRLLIFWPSSAITLLIFYFIDSLTVSSDNKFFIISFKMSLSTWPFDQFLFSTQRSFTRWVSSLRSLTVINELYTDTFVCWYYFLLMIYLFTACFFFNE